MIEKMNVNVHHMKTYSFNSSFTQNMNVFIERNTVQGATAEGLKRRMQLWSRGLPTPCLDCWGNSHHALSTSDLLSVSLPPHSFIHLFILLHVTNYVFFLP